MKQAVVTTSTTRALIAGVDTLILNVKQVDSANHPLEQQTLPDGVEELLSDWQEMAKRNQEPCITPWQHEGQRFQMWHKGAEGWKWVLKNGLIDVLLGAYLNKRTLLRVRFSSEYLWRRGVHAALKETHAFLSRYFDEGLVLQPAEIHVCADMVGLSIPRHYEQVFVSRAKVQRPVFESYLDRPIYRHNQLETLQFSGHGSPMSASIYDKPKEIVTKRRNKEWFFDLWKAKGWQQGQPVWRVECRLKRTCLHEMEIEDADTMLSHIPALWVYCVGCVGEHDGWLRMVIPIQRIGTVGAGRPQKDGE